MLAFMIAVAFLATVLFGLAPGGRRSGRARLFRPALARSSGGRGGWLRRGLVAAQVGLAVVLLVGACLLIRTAHTARHSSSRLRAAARCVFALTPKGGGYGDADMHAYRRDLLARVSAIPGVASASLSDSSPVQINRLGGAGFRGVGPEGGCLRSKANLYFVSDGFFKTLGVFDSSRSRLLAFRQAQIPSTSSSLANPSPIGCFPRAMRRPCHLRR